MTTTQLTLILLGLLIFMGANLAVIFYLFNRFSKNNGAGDKNDQGFLLMQNQLSDLVRVVDLKIGETNKSMSEGMRVQFSESQKLVDQFLRELGQMTEKVTRMEETGKQMVSFTDQLQSLQDILKNPKQRGILGEYYLETLLKNIMGPTGYQMQYPFPDGTIVDAVVFVKDKIIPIDSKFSLENYNRTITEKDPVEKERYEKLFVNDLKNRIAETSKYIQPEQGTMDFAFMFIPHEAIYYDLLINKIGSVADDNESLIQRAAGKYKVIIVSPTSFLAYLQTVLQGLRALQIEETAKDIVKRVTELGKHLKSYEEYHGKLGNALGTAVNHFNATGKEFKKIDKDVMRITGEAAGIDIAVLDAPDKGE